MNLNRNIIEHELRTIKAELKEVHSRIALCTHTIFLATLVILLSISPGISSLINSVAIHSTGEISTTKVVAESGSASDIQAAVDFIVATNGVGNVYIPEGTFDFVEVGQWVTVNIPAGVNLFGAPTERDANGQVIEWKTVLVMPWDVPGNDQVGIPAWFVFNGNGDPNKPSRFSDIKMIGYRDFDSSSPYMSRGISMEDVIDFRIDHSFFKHITGGLWIGGKANGKVRGVIDHCKFINDYGVPEPYGIRTVGYGVGIGLVGTTNWPNLEDIMGKYTDYTVFIEDNYFSKWRHSVCSGHGAHYVFRNNIIQYDFGFGSIDAHGTYMYVGTRAIEVYNNQFLDSLGWVGGGVVCFHRGGAGVYFNNTVRGYRYLAELNDEGSVPYCWPHDVYIWNNDAPEVQLVSVTGSAQEGEDYFFYAMPDYTPYPYPHPLTVETTP